MNVTFLEADMPLTKSFTATTKTSYPSAYEFTSHTYAVATIEEFFGHLNNHAAMGHCLLKGELSRPLVKESRAGTTDSLKPTSWICLDFDGIPTIHNFNRVLSHLQGSATIDHIVQYSASHGVQGQPQNVKCHVFFLLDSPVTPAEAKLWLKQFNLEVPELNNNLQLTKTGNALSYILDPTVVQNDKLIYIAPPQCDPVTLDTLLSASQPRIQLVKGAKRTLSSNVITQYLRSPDAIKAQIETRINELRAAKNLPARKRFAYKIDSKTGTEYLTKPDACTVTSEKHERGFIYVNLNGGDSWGYYFPETDATFLFNFKDEPVYKLSEIDPAYYKRILPKVKAAQKAQAQVTLTQALNAQSTPTASGQIYLVFRDLKSDVYYNGIFDQVTQTWELHRASSEKRLADFMVQHGQPEPDVIPIWDLVFDPKAPPINVQNRIVNLYEESKILAKAAQTIQNNPLQTMPPIVQRIIWSVVGNDQEAFDHFINWLAVIAQHKQRTQTAWLFNGIQGTGKGLLAHNVLRPIFGHKNTAFFEAVHLEDRFNDQFERSLLTIVDELTIGDLEGSSKIMGTMKSMITEPMVTVRKMRTAPYSVPNYNNWIAFANTKEQIRIEMTDRRYNVGSYQTEKLQITKHEIEVLLPQEIELFAQFLLSYQADVALAGTVLQNEARAEMRDLSMSSIDLISEAITQGNLEELFSYIVELNQAQGKTMNTASGYKDLMYAIVLQDYKALTREELQLIFAHCVGDVPTSPSKFSRFLAHHNIRLSRLTRQNRPLRGYHVKWKYDEDWYEAIKAQILIEKAPKLKVVDRDGTQ